MKGLRARARALCPGLMCMSAHVHTYTYIGRCARALKLRRNIKKCTGRAKRFQEVRLFPRLHLLLLFVLHWRQSYGARESERLGVGVRSMPSYGRERRAIYLAAALSFARAREHQGVWVLYIPIYVDGLRPPSKAMAIEIKVPGRARE